MESEPDGVTFKLCIFDRYYSNLFYEPKSSCSQCRRRCYWAEVPSIPGCMTQGDTFDELLQNLYEAVEGCLSIDVDEPTADADARIMEIAI
ncbi:hypothetical protein GCM10028808_59430 [Spirosoma migulaei]